MVPGSTYWKKQWEECNHLNGSTTVPVIQLFISSKLGNFTAFQMGQKFRLSKFRCAINVHYTILVSKLVPCSTFWMKPFEHFNRPNGSITVPVIQLGVSPEFGIFNTFLLDPKLGL